MWQSVSRRLQYTPCIAAFLHNNIAQVIDHLGEDNPIVWLPTGG